MAEPWFEPAWQFGAYYGGGVGGLLGLAGGVLGCCGFLVQRGVGRVWVLGAYLFFAAFGVVSLIVGVYAWLSGQPYAIWYPLTLHGVVCVGVFGALFPVIRHQYQLAEQRKIDAEGLRRS